jgi:uroporphyrinogen-III synthase
LLSEQGYQPVLFPTLEIKPINNKPLKVNYDALIFISANAVEYGLKTLKILDYQSAKIFAVGAATAKKLEETVSVLIIYAKFSSPIIQK